ncbi:TonB-dependent receptor [Dyadobacter sp. CY345]|uniref:TonB-dependent receptor n=1 Tax=Dyadobacter sp. CY345 TaxID=2909335 RepID=UPI001F3593A9|nr:TonB-dependent receptor [Dyadobacter sp. CY345]MCF2444221.1 TonB-dependent receptor [Dyadobacter sp. CY345]
MYCINFTINKSRIPFQITRTGIFSFILILLSQTLSFSQNTISGRIISTNGIGIEGVNITVGDTKKGTVTNNEGFFQIGNLSSNDETLNISIIGYHSKKIKIKSFKTQTHYLTITLQEDIRRLDEVVIEEKKNNIQVERLPDVHDFLLPAGKKNEVIQLGGVNANISEKTGRQIFAKIPGVFVYDMDGSGNQINISTRGLDPHRSWEYNIRQNGIITNSDMYGYPASHYSPAMESIERIELVRGSASLQYGAQFGGMINYVTKQADTTKSFSFETVNSGGLYGLFSSYNAISGKIGKLTYSAYYQKRHSDGYRKNSKSDAESQFASLTYEFNKSFKIKAELGRSSYVYQIPGPLTDAMFDQDSRQATRSRNYFNPDIYIPSIVIDWKISSSTKLRLTNSGVFGSRNSVMFDAFANIPDAIDPTTNQYKTRQIDIDNFKSFTSELRLVHQYKVAGMTNFVSGGIQVMKNNLRRRQLGKGTTGSDFDLTLTDPAWGRDLHMKTTNVAIFVENLIYLTPRLTVSPGVRVESGTTDMTGKITYYQPETLPNSIKHKFPLLGISSQYKLGTESKIYAGFSQAYRPVVFKDIIPGSVLEQVDKNLKDAKGYNLEAGINGRIGEVFSYDMSVFQMLYKNRMGTLALNDDQGKAYILRTNTGNTMTKGLEVYAEYKPLSVSGLKGSKTEFSVFTSTSYFNARYLKGRSIVNNENTDVKGNKLEGVPTWISRNGLQFTHNKLLATLQYSYVSELYSDALNTVEPSVNGARGKVPSYGIWDLNGTWRIAKSYTLRFGVNNFLDKKYFTKRPTMYPGAGIWTSDGRSIVISFGIKI